MVLDGFVQEVKALKPGNVSQYAAGHDMCFEDFEHSARLCAPVLCNQQLGIGERILAAVELTREQVGCNTNLGMLLLYAPLIKAYTTDINDNELRINLNRVLETLDQADASNVYRAISLAQPGGLGRLEENDVSFIPDISLLEAMAMASERDLVARQYVSGYEEVFNIGFKSIVEFDMRWNSVEWAAVGCYLRLMSRFPDSHIRRKFGLAVAEQVQNSSKAVFERFKNKKNPAEAKTELLEFDKELKDSGINPGTSADLTAASLLVYAMTNPA